MNYTDDNPILINDDALILIFCDPSVEEICDDYLSPYLGGKLDGRQHHETTA